MKTSQRGLEDIIFSEGEVLHAYQDTLTRPDGTKYKDVLTIGCGHTTAAGPPAVVPGMTITHAESREILARALAAVEARVLLAFKSKAPPQTVFDGAVSFDFNTGGILKASWVPLWLAGKMVDAEQHFMLWNKPAQIVNRREREADLIFRGKYHSREQIGTAKPIPSIPPPPDIPAPKPQGKPPAPLPHGPIISGAVAASAGAGGITGNFWWALGAFVAVAAFAYLISHLKRKG